MENLLIDACRWHVDAEAPIYKQRALDHFRERYSVLLEFMRENGLLRDVGLGLYVSDWMEFEFRESQLTEEGFALVNICHGKWSVAFGEAHTQRHLIQWKRKLSKLRSSVVS